MADPTNENPGAIPPEDITAAQEPVGDAETPTAAMAAAAAVPSAAGAPPRETWYRRRWAVIAGAAAAAAILLLGGAAIGTAIAGDGPDGRSQDGPGMFRDGDGPGHGGWGDRDGQGRGEWGDRGTAPGMGHGGQGFGHDGDDWGHPPEWQTPGATPAPSTTP